jgi:hypothetical protein
MAIVRIAEFSQMFQDANAPGQIARCPPLVQQAMTSTGTSAQSAVFNAATRFIRVHTDNIVSIMIGTNPVAVIGAPNGTMRLAANQTEYFGVNGGNDQIAIITDT